MEHVGQALSSVALQYWVEGCILLLRMLLRVRVYY